MFVGKQEGGGGDTLTHLEDFEIILLAHPSAACHFFCPNSTFLFYFIFLENAKFTNVLQNKIPKNIYYDV